MSPSNRIREQRESLPTFEYKDELIEAIKEYNVLVVIGETGKLVDSHSSTCQCTQSFATPC